MLAFRHPRERLALGFGPHHFIQINALVNERMVARVSDLLALGSDDRLLDLFCGVGNFTLPLARNAGETVGVEGAPDLVAQAWKNARANDVDNASFCCSDLQQPALSEPWANRQYSAVLLDPPRSGAAAMMTTIASMDIPRVAYVSCHVDTLARDARTLVSEHGYRLTHAGVIDMFPHTTHFESMALLERC
jgi:23S rRNA (uracil1939-C5)-methyltransferase